MAPIADRDLFDFLEHTADAAFTVTDAGEICSWNSSAEALFGSSSSRAAGPGALVARTLRSALHPQRSRLILSVWLV